jgi:urea transporter
MFGFLIAIAAGAVTPMVEDPLARRAAKSMGQHVEVQENEVRALAFMIAMIIAGVVCNVLDTGSPLGLAVGGALGYFGARLLRWGQRRIEDRRS